MSFRTQLFLASLLILLSGCKDKNLTVYEAPKDIRPTPHTVEAPASIQTNDLVWENPKTWTTAALSSFRKGSFNVTDSNGQKVDISVIAFPNRAGGLLPNINRWRGQLGLAPLTPEQLPEQTTPLTIAGLPATLVEMVSETTVLDEKFKSRIIAAILPYNHQSWFFKMSGEDSAVLAQEETFMSFLKTVQTPTSP
ncbi:MAG: hypothetical protein JKY51_10740 [Opitutaceae bacterium]|nr:hypothetical protein [Opitutaceae bacterium]